jgi:hypothetical protein
MISSRAQDSPDQDLYDVHPTAHYLLHQHAKEIFAHSRPSIRRRAAHVSIKKKANHIHALIHYLQHSASKYFFAIFSSPQTVAADPIGATFALIVLPVIHISLLFIQVVFLLAGWLGGGKLGNWFSEEYGSGLSAVNMVSTALCKPYHM